MEYSDFKIGDIFFTATGQWKCIDVGSKVIIAVQQSPFLLSPKGTQWFLTVFDYQDDHTALIFDEYDFPSCYKSVSELEQNLGNLFVKK